jgi:hypothetical protein
LTTRRNENGQRASKGRRAWRNITRNCSRRSGRWICRRRRRTGMRRTSRLRCVSRHSPLLDETVSISRLEWLSRSEQLMRLLTPSWIGASRSSSGSRIKLVRLLVVFPRTCEWSYSPSSYAHIRRGLQSSNQQGPRFDQHDQCPSSRPIRLNPLFCRYSSPRAPLLLLFLLSRVDSFGKCRSHHPTGRGRASRGRTGRCHRRRGVPSRSDLVSGRFTARLLGVTHKIEMQRQRQVRCSIHARLAARACVPVSPRSRPPFATWPSHPLFLGLSLHKLST